MTIHSEKGFTLLELLVVTVIISVLCYLGMTSFYVYRADAAYSVVEQTFHGARTAGEAALADIDHPPIAANGSQKIPGPIQDAATQTYLPGMMLPKSISLEARYDPACTAGGCEAEFIQLRHCVGSEYLEWSRMGDGVEALVPHIAGSGCP